MANMPTVSTLQKSLTTIIVTGTNFGSTAATPTATMSLEGIAADSVTFDSSTQVTATWTDGVPLTLSTGAKPVLRFKDPANVVLTAIVPDTVSLTNVLSVPTVTA
jgi:hypothetical protein